MCFVVCRRELYVNKCFLLCEGVSLYVNECHPMCKRELHVNEWAILCVGISYT